VLFVTVARDRVIDSEDSYVSVVIFFIFLFFRPPIFGRPWADIREMLPHDAVCPEIVYPIGVFVHAP